MTSETHVDFHVELTEERQEKYQRSKLRNSQNNSRKTEGGLDNCDHVNKSNCVYFHSFSLKFSCDVCGKKFEDNKAFNSHMVHWHLPEELENGQTFPCELCGIKSYVSKKSLASHMLTCELSGEMLNTDSSFVKFSCDICRKKFENNTTFNSHMIYYHSSRGHGNNKLLCGLCGIKSYVFKKSLLLHMRTCSRGEVLDIDSYTFSCRVCGEKFENDKNLNSHMRYWHSSKGQGNYKKFPCELCGIKSYFAKRSLRRHMLSHRGEKKHACSECKKQFSQADALKNHIKVHINPKHLNAAEVPGSDSNRENGEEGLGPGIENATNTHASERDLCRELYIYRTEKQREQIDKSDKVSAQNVSGNTEGQTTSVCVAEKDRGVSKPMRDVSEESSRDNYLVIEEKKQKLWICNVCGKTFNQSGNLNTHLLVHTGDMPYFCPVCEKRFRQKGNMKTHLAVHTSEKTWECDQCGKRFRCQSNLWSHQRIHSDVKAYKCTVCGHAFHDPRNLLTHSYTHVGAKLYPCSQCGDGFSRKQFLSNHILKHHAQT